jgi:hypothetical protein
LYECLAPSAAIADIGEPTQFLNRRVKEELNMPPRTPRPPAQAAPREFEIDDAKSFDENFTGFLASLTPHDPALAAVAQREMPRLLRGEITQTELLNALKLALEAPSE